MSYCCYSCDYQSNNKSNLRAHMKTHLGEWPHMYKTFDRWSTTAAADLRSHMMPCFEDKPYECGYYDFKRDRVGDFGVHTLPGIRSRKYGPCDNKPDGARNLRAHMKTHSGEEEHDCEQCDYGFDRVGQKPHMRPHSGENTCRSRSFSTKGTACMNEPDEKTSCGICDYSSSSFSSSHLKRHVAALVKRLLKNYIGEKSYECELCDHSSDLTEHVATLMRTQNGGKPLGCGSCDCGCNPAASSKKRMRICSTENPYAFGLCDAKCKKDSGLPMQMRTLTREKPEDCQLCQYESSSSSSGSGDYMRIRPGDLKRRKKSRSKKKHSKGGSWDYITSNKIGQFKPPKGKKPFAYDGFPGYFWNPPGDMNAPIGMHAGDSLPYAVVLVTGDPPQW